MPWCCWTYFLGEKNTWGTSSQEFAEHAVVVAVVAVVVVVFLMGLAMLSISSYCKVSGSWWKHPQLLLSVNYHKIGVGLILGGCSLT